MSLWSRIAEALATIGDSVAGFLASLTSRRVAEPERTVAFTIGMIALGAKMAKADGVVTHSEIAAFKQVFQVPPEELGHVARVFNLAKQDIAGYEFYARQMGRLFARKRTVLEDVLDGLFHIAKADGGIHEREVTYLENVAKLFGFSAHEFASIKARHVGTDGDDPYVILGVGRHLSDGDIKKHYRRLVRDHHPDKHVAAGMPREMIRIATERLARINAAFDTIARERGL